MSNYADKVLRSYEARLWFELTALLINIGSKKYQLMIHLNPALLWYCPNSGISCHAIVLPHELQFYQGKEGKKYFQVKIIQITKDLFYCCELWQFPLCIKKDNKCQTSYYNTWQLQNRDSASNSHIQYGHMGKEQTVFLTDFSASMPIWQIITWKCYYST